MKLGPIAEWGLNLEKKTIPVNTENFQTNKFDNKNKTFLMLSNWISGKSKQDSDYKQVQKIIDIILKCEKMTFNNNSLNLNLAFNYGFKNEIQDVLEKIKSAKININLNGNISIVNDLDILSDNAGCFEILNNTSQYEWEGIADTSFDLDGDT